MLRYPFLIFLMCIIPLLTSADPASADAYPVTRLTINGPISPAQSELLDDALSFAKKEGSSGLLLVLDTPGGLGESMREMVSSILNAPVPVMVWVGPAGARAASAGVFIVAASEVAGMAPQTTIGAASPVGLGGGEIAGTMAKKVTNDFSSLVRSVAESRGRNAKWYTEAVEKSVSITAQEAFAQKVVEVIAVSAESFLKQAGQGGLLPGMEKGAFKEESISITDFVPGFRYGFLSWLLHPQIAYLLLLGGMLGLFIEITHPGTVFPGVFGGFCLLLALYAMSVLPTNIAGLLLIGFSLILMILEIKVVSYGMLSVAALAALIFGSIILFGDEYGSIQIPLSIILWPAAFVSVTVGTILWLVTRAQRKKTRLGGEGMVGLTGKIINWEGDSGQILVRGEIWAATAAQSDFVPSRGSMVAIVSINGLTLEIEGVSR
ncbi:nodulation protein NfeD [uncultured Pseudodesulfovibrio sp.]|uniref:NfeD family protein n=1 Tax=uncultured Pseudodesulfovibrio sp. TaxID=2035858 RepID=UPI0029C893C9|nr:nodulation protein NfeD [uncultured Pseudodesulfovibrio sp.]